MSRRERFVPKVKGLRGAAEQLPRVKLEDDKLKSDLAQAAAPVYRVSLREGPGLLGAPSAREQGSPGKGWAA